MTRRRLLWLAAALVLIALGAAAWFLTRRDGDVQ
jgi:hypothetical protein